MDALLAWALGTGVIVCLYQIAVILDRIAKALEKEEGVTR